MTRENILFDLDGTLTDPMVGITKSVQYALRHYGIEEPDLRQLTPFIGPPLTDSFRRYYQFSEEQAREAVLVYREYYAEKGILENEEIPGIRKMLGELKGAGKRLFVATSKPEVFARRIIGHFRMGEFFTFVGGADLEETRVKKGDVIRYVMEREGIQAESAVMVGDREHDIIGARENGIACVGVLFGYGSREELEAAGAEQIVKDAVELTRVLII